MNNINKITAFEQAHYDGSTVRVMRNGLPISRILGGVDLDDAQIIGLAGAPKGSTIQLLLKQSWTPEELEGEVVPPGLFFIVTGPYIRTENWVGIFRESENKLGIYLKLIDFHPGRVSGLAARMVARIVRTAWSVPEIVILRLFAAGGRISTDLDPNSGERWGGFVAWPTYGFDMDLLPNYDRDDAAFSILPQRPERLQIR